MALVSNKIRGKISAPPTKKKILGAGTAMCSTSKYLTNTERKKQWKRMRNLLLFILVSPQPT